jgi:hypothetical protein
MVVEQAGSNSTPTYTHTPSIEILDNLLLFLNKYLRQKARERGRKRKISKGQR